MFSEIIYCFLVFNVLYIICLYVFFLFCKIGRITVKKKKNNCGNASFKGFFARFLSANIDCWTGGKGCRML